MRLRKRIVRTHIEEILVDVDEGIGSHSDGRSPGRGNTLSFRSEKGSGRADRSYPTPRGPLQAADLQEPAVQEYVRRVHAGQQVSVDEASRQREQA